jgi:hypothetical protein
MSLRLRLVTVRRSQRLCRIAGERLDVFRRVMKAQRAAKHRLAPICVDDRQKLGCTKMSYILVSRTGVNLGTFT